MENEELKILKTYLQLKNEVVTVVKSIKFNMNMIDLSNPNLVKLMLLIKSLEMTCHSFMICLKQAESQFTEIEIR